MCGLRDRFLPAGKERRWRDPDRVLAWPSSLVTGLICDGAETLCDIRGVPFLLIVVLGGVQYYLLGHVAGQLLKLWKQD